MRSASGSGLARIVGAKESPVRWYCSTRGTGHVLLTPPVKPATYALWFGPPLLLATGGLVIFFAARSRRTEASVSAPAPLTVAERARLARLLDGDDDTPPAGRP